MHQLSDQISSLSDNIWFCQDLWHELGLQDATDGPGPLSPLPLRLGRELVSSLGGVQDEAEALLPEARPEAVDDQEAGAGVTQEDLALGVGRQHVHVVHQLPALQGAPALLVDVLGAGAGLA